MNFFQHQEQAKRNTKRLVFYFVVAVLSTILLIYLFVHFLLSDYFGTRENGVNFSWWDPTHFLNVTSAVLLIVIIGSLAKLAQLRQGGAVVAKMLGGTLIPPNPGNANQKRLLNIVEEMAIASGIPVPPVYLLAEEPGINAFAAGTAPKDAVIGVSQGAIDTLDRDELQGVIGHEFSHILNGDMALNVRLLGVVSGLLVITIIGRIFMRSRGRKNPLPLLGLGLFILGYLGVFFANLIKAAVSREREYLADASSVQYTRNPEGLAGALKKIAGLTAGSKILNHHAAELSHFYFANGLSKSFLGWTATHPPLADRIKRLDPKFSGDNLSTSAKIQQDSAALAPQVSALSSSAPQVVATIGQLSADQLTQAQEILSAMPPTLKAAVHDPDQVELLVYALLIQSEAVTVGPSVKDLLKRFQESDIKKLISYYQEIKALPREQSLPLLEMALATLKSLTTAQYCLFRETVGVLIHADGKMDLFEFVLEQFLRQVLDSYFFTDVHRHQHYKSFTPIIEDLGFLLSTLSHHGHDDSHFAEAAFHAASASLGELESQPHYVAKADCSFSHLQQVMDKLMGCSYPMKQKIILACVTGIIADGKIKIEEFELLRTVACLLDCPIPPQVSYK